MAQSQCDICGKTVRKSEVQTFSSNGQEINLCPDCWTRFELCKFNVSSRPDSLEYFRNHLEQHNCSYSGAQFVNLLTEKYGGSGPDDPENAESDSRANILLSTASVLEGYRVIKQCGVVFGETVFKHGAFSALGAAISNVGFGSRELEGSVSLIEEARQFAYNKMIKAAADKGANAIIAIDSDNTIGADVMYLSLYGTAVLVEKMTYEDNSPDNMNDA